jgi:Asp-tRNA(Asn)/Glu-tRNA(Gln) amidotransferase A subunit family amidase
MPDLTEMGAASAAAEIRAGRLTSEALVRACLERIDRLEGTIGAWTYLDPDAALRQARERDRAQRAGDPLGPLHGVPVGVKDVFDTAGMPTENGTVLHAGRRPGEDATVVSLLREAGAVILGKTVTTELAVYAPGKTRNPRDPERTPGGSSSGSAAAVAARMVPLALGTQTNGSVIRPAAYCGVVGFKPTFGAISRHGALAQSRPLDQVGVFARSVEDAALLAESLMVFDGRDPDMRPSVRPRLAEAAVEPPPVPPRLAFVRTPMWGQASPDSREAIEGLAARLGAAVEDVLLPEEFGRVVDWHRTVMEPDLARSFEGEYARGKDRLSPILREMLERGSRVPATEYLRAAGQIPVMNGLLRGILDRFDAILTPATTGEAPVGLGSTGSPIFCTIWTFCGTPAVTLPLLRGGSGMPIGVQLVGARGDDARLLRCANWFAGLLRS